MSRARRGANALEFALVLPVLLALLTGLVDYCWVFLLRDGATYAARMGARAGAMTHPNQNPEQVAASTAADAWEALGLGANPTIEAFRADDPQLVIVRITLSVSETIGFVASPETLQVVAAEQMEKQP